MATPVKSRVVMVTRFCFLGCMCSPHVVYRSLNAEMLIDERRSVIDTRDARWQLNFAILSADIAVYRSLSPEEILA